MTPASSALSKGKEGNGQGQGNKGSEHTHIAWHINATWAHSGRAASPQSRIMSGKSGKSECERHTGGANEKDERQHASVSHGERRAETRARRAAAATIQDGLDLTAPLGLPARA